MSQEADPTQTKDDCAGDGGGGGTGGGTIASSALNPIVSSPQG